MENNAPLATDCSPMTNETAPVQNGGFDFTFESVLLLVLSVFMCIFGLLLFSITTGALPYTPDSTYGLFLVIVALQVITMGKTPLGEVRRTWLVILIGIAAGILGMLACFIPGFLSDLVRALVGAILTIGGAGLLIQLFVLRDKAALWLGVPGVLRQMTAACVLVYLASFLLGLVTLVPGVTTDTLTAALLIIGGAALFWLAQCIEAVARQYPAKPKPCPAGVRRVLFRDAPISLAVAIIIFLGVLLVLLAVLLVPINLGMLPFSPDGQLGMLLVVMSVQILAMGETPLGSFRRSRFIVVIGLVFAAMGVFSCIVPGILTGLLRVMLGVLNLAGSLILLARRVVPMAVALRAAPEKPAAMPRPVRNLFIIQTALNITGILFGLSMLMPGIISGMLTAAILFCNGLLIFLLARILGRLPAAE